MKSTWSFSLDVKMLLCCCFFLQPLSWQQPYVPVLARGMLDFLMVPTAFLMGCHLDHYEEVATVSKEPVKMMRLAGEAVVLAIKVCLEIIFLFP